MRPRKVRQPDTMRISIMSHLKVCSSPELEIWARSVGMLGEHMHNSRALARQPC